MALIVTGAVPEEIRVRVCVAFVFTVTLPNGSEVGLAESPGEAPVPVSVTTVVAAMDESLVMATVPDTEPATSGWKLT